MRGRLRSILPSLVGGLLALSCAADLLHDGAEGLLRVRFLVAEGKLGPAVTPGGVISSPKDAAAPLSQPDSIRLVIRDARGSDVASEGIAYAGSGDVSLDLTLPAGGDLTILMTGEGEGPDGRGILYYGRQPGVSIERGRTTEATVLLESAVSAIAGIDGAAGSPSYLVRWHRIPSATSYLLRERTVDGFTDFTLGPADTSRLFTPGVENGSARLGARGDLLGSPRRRREGFSTRGGPSPAPPASHSAAKAGLVSYRVRCALPLGPGIFGDSASVDLSLWYDLPQVVGIAPADGATGVGDESGITIEFDRPMVPPPEPDTLSTLRELSTGQEAAVTRTYIDRTLTLRPVERLHRGEWYRVRVSTRLRDEQDRPLDQDPASEGLQAFISDFRVEEYDPMRVVAAAPADGATLVPANTAVSITLLRAADRTTVTSSSFVLIGPAGAVEANRQVDLPGTGLTLTPLQNLLYDTEYTIRIETTVLDEARGEPLDQEPLEPGFQPFVSTFHTIPQPLGPSIVSTTPVAGEANHPIYEPVKIDFDRAIRLTSFRHPETVQLQRDLGGLWVNIEVGPGPYTSDGQHFTLTPIQELKRDTAHRLVVRAGPSGVLDAEGVPFDQDYGTAGYQDFEARFRTEQNVKVDSCDPLDGATQVAWDVEVRLILDGPIQPESVSDTTFGLRLDAAAVAGSRWISSDQREIRFRPDSPLEGYRTYTVWVGTGLRSARGGSFDQQYSLAGHQPYSSQFQTVQETVAPRVTSVLPADSASAVPDDQIVSITFSEPVRAFLVEDNFYVTAVDSAGVRLAATVTVRGDNLAADLRPSSPLAPATAYHVHVGTLVTDLFGNGLDQDPGRPGKQRFHSVFFTEPERMPPQVAAVDPADGAGGVGVESSVRVTFTEPIERSSLTGALNVAVGSTPHPGGIAFEDGDRTAIWTPTWPLLHGANYEVRVDTLAVDLAGNRLDQFPDAEHPGNDPFISHFTTGPDLQGPRLISVAPPDGADGISVGVQPVLHFDEAIDASTVLGSGIAMADSLGAMVAISPTLSTDGTEVTLVHASPLAFEFRYEITVDPAVTDMQGNPFDGDPGLPGNQPLTTRFRTQVENIPPTVLSISPADQAAGVPVAQVITVAFSEACDPTSIDPATFRLLRDDAPVGGTRTVSAVGDTISFAPDSLLHHETTYEVRVEGVKDLKGNRLDQDPIAPGAQPFVSGFTTVAAPAPAPRVVSTMPADGALDVDPLIHPRLAFNRAMDTTTFSYTDPGLLRRGSGFPLARAAEPGDSAFVYTPAAPLEPGRYIWFVSSALTDTQGNRLDQDPATPGDQWFSGGFEVGKRPLADAGPGLCSDGSDLTIHFDGRGSTDPDGNIAAVDVTWDWGDGTTSTYQDSTGLRASHTYACADAKGCDGIDNDGDGQTDETGPGGCDESYRVTMTLEDESGLSDADTTGVAFCAFLVRSSDPPGGTAGVDTLKTIRIRLTSPCDPSTADTAAVYLALQGADTVAIARSTEDGDRLLVIDPLAPLLPDTTYAVHVTQSLRSASGHALDQLPCTAGEQEFVASFRTAARSLPPTARTKKRPAAFLGPP